MTKIKKNNMAWNLKSKIKYLGKIIDAKGRNPGSSRSGTIKNMPALTNVSTLQAFLGLPNYGKFTSNMQVLRAPLNKL